MSISQSTIGRSIRTCLAAVPAVAVASMAGAASIAWDGGGDGIRWLDPDNWDSDSVPTAADIATLGVDGLEVVVDGVAETNRYILTDASAETVTVRVVAGGVLSEGINFAGFGATGSTPKIEIAGGTMTGADQLRGTNDSSNPGLVTMTEGTFSGYTTVRNRTVMEFTGGTMEVATAGGVGSINIQAGSSLSIDGTTTVVIDASANGVNDLVTANGVVNWTGGTVQFRFDPGYIPQVGDTFDVGTGGGLTLTDPGDSSTPSIAMTDVDGLYNIVWDVTDFSVANGAPSDRGILTIAEISLIPEPGSLALAATGLLLLTRRAR